jgi:hypothetical protein
MRLVQNQESTLVLCALLFVGGCTLNPKEAPSTETADEVQPANLRQVIEGILEADLGPEARMAALEPYIDVGDHMDDIERLLPERRELWGHGPMFMEVEYGDWHKPGLIVYYYPDLESYAITYRTKDKHCVKLRSDDPITWPKTTDGHNAELRQRNPRVRR